MVRMAQPFNMSLPLVDGHGNFGSVDGDSAAAMRYTEVRMAPPALELLRDIDKDTVDFNLNFDDSLKEPSVLPGRYPNLLVNGASGIAVGLATNIPPHNLAEAIDAVIAQIDNPDISLDALMKHMSAPDFPTGGYMVGKGELREAYETGRGKITLRAKTHVEQLKNGKKLIVITEMPYQVNKAAALEKILALSQEKKQQFSGISDIRDESDRTGMRAVIEVRKDADEQKLLSYLFKYSDLQMSFGINMVAIADGKPQQLGLKAIIAYYIRHQENVVTRRTRFELDAARRKEHILAGLMIAIANLDEVIRIIRASKTPKEARDALMARFELSQIQAQAILDLRLQRLTGLEMLDIKNEYDATLKLIAELESILASKKKLFAVIKQELSEIRKKYKFERRTQMLLGDEHEMPVEENEPKPSEETTVMLLDNGTVRRAKVPELSDESRASFIIPTRTDKKLWLFTNIGAELIIPVEDIPEVKGKERAPTLASLVKLETDETVIAAMEADTSGTLVFFTQNGFVKRTAAGEYDVRVRRTTAVTLKNDTLIRAEKLLDGASFLLITKLGMSIRIEAGSVPATGRVSGGVHGIKLDEDDSVVFALQLFDEGEVLLISDRGYAKRTLAFEYEQQGRNGKGLKTFDFKRNGSNGNSVAAALYVREPFDFMIVQKHSAPTRMNTENIFIEPRLSKGMPLVASILDDYVMEAYKL
jgi:DNA gyrase subunit A